MEARFLGEANSQFVIIEKQVYLTSHVQQERKSIAVEIELTGRELVNEEKVFVRPVR